MRLDEYDSTRFDRGRPRWLELIWLATQWLVLRSWLPGSMLRIFALRLFGACIGQSVVIKAGVRVKFPWRLSIGDHTWIGEDVWIDNLVPVTIGSHCCISQGAYLCTGNHDWSTREFKLITAEIEIHDHAFIGAMSRIAGGVEIGEGSVTTLGSVVTNDTQPWTISCGNASVDTRVRPKTV